MNLTKQDMKDLPNSPAGDETKEKLVEYVSLVMDGVTKPDALKRALPERYMRAVDRANDAESNGKGKGNVLNANVKKEINQVERSLFCRKLYESEHKDWWIKFLGKKQKAYETLFKIGLDEGESARNRVEAIKTMLQFMPDKAPEAIKVDVQVTSDDDFKAMLKEKQRMLHKAANDIVDVEVIEA